MTTRSTGLKKYMQTQKSDSLLTRGPKDRRNKSKLGSQVPSTVDYAKSLDEMNAGHGSWQQPHSTASSHH